MRLALAQLNFTVGAFEQNVATMRRGVLIGFVDRNPATEGKALYNAAALCHDGRVVGRCDKSLLPTYEIFEV